MSTLYDYRIMHLNDHRVAIVTSGISTIAEAKEAAARLRVEDLLFRDRFGAWHLWQKAAGPRSLALGGVPTTARDIALAVAVARYIR